ncbi:MAG: LamG-like jellyroll fold domain-containing protein [Acidimicrobiales bacterium]
MGVENPASAETGAAFNGTNQYVSLPSGFSWLSGGFTIEGWVEPSTASSWARVIEFGTGAGTNNVLFSAGGPGGTDLALGIWNNGAYQNFVEPNVLTLDSWQYVAATVQPGGTATLYLNGTVLATTTMTVAPASVTYTQNAIGKSNWSQDPYFAGAVAQVAVDSSPLSSAAVADHYSAAAGMPGEAGAGGYGSTVAGDSPSGWWGLGETSGSTASDASGNGANGTYENNPVLAAQEPAAAETGVALNGSNQYVNLPSGFSWLGNSSGFTIEGWVDPTATGSWERIVEFGTGPATDNVFLSLGPTGQDVQLGVWNNGSSGGVQASGVLQLGVWQYLAGTFTPNGSGGGTGTVYLNGAEVASGLFPVTAAAVTYNDDGIGKSNWSQDSYLHGAVAQVAVYPTVLSAAVIGRHFAAAARQVSPSLISPVGGPISPGEAVGAADPSAAGGCGCGQAGSAVTTGEPIDVATGAMIETATDVAVPGAGIPLELTRTYDSSLASQQAAGGVTPGPVGYGWSYNLGMTVTAGNGTATVNQETGSQITFSSYTQGSSPAWCTGTTNFCASAPRILATLNHNADGTWTMVRQAHGQTTFTFSVSGALTSISNASGDSLNAATTSPGSGACPSGASTCTTWTSSASGRQLTLAFDSSGRLSSASDGGADTATYCFYGQSCAGGTNLGGAEDLQGVSQPGGLESTFSYDPGNSSTSLVHDLLTEVTPAGGTITNTYDTSGRVTKQIGPAQTLTLVYNGNNDTYSGGTTTVSTWPDGTSGSIAAQVVQYQYSSGALIAETTGYGTPQASTQYSNRDETSLANASTRDGDGNSTQNTLVGYNGSTPLAAGELTQSTDPTHNTRAYAYNSFNQPWCQVDPADYANGARCPSTPPASPPTPGAPDPYLGVMLSYYDSSDQLTATTDALGNTTTYSYTSGVAGVPDRVMYCSVDPVDYQKNVVCPAYGATHVTGTATATFDSAGDRLTSTDADGNTTTYVYNAAGHPGLVSSQTDPNGTTTTFSYNAVREVTSRVVSFGSYSATSLNAYDTAGRKYCTVAPLEAAQNVTCPSSPPPSPPTPSNDPYLGATISTYDSDGRVIQNTNPLGGITYTAYDQAGQVFCTVEPYEAAQNVTCPSTPPSTPPTIGNDPYLGATITSYDGDGRPVQVTNPLGGITLSAYDPANNVSQTTVESNNTTSAPDIVTNSSYDGDNRVVTETVASGGSVAATTRQSYDPNGNVYCSVSANAVASAGYQCPTWQVGWITAPPNPTSLYSSSPSASQANNVTTTFYNANGDQVQTTNPDVQTTVTAVDGNGRAYCSSDPTNVSAWLTAHPSGTYPYPCPTRPPTSPPAQGSNPGYLTTIFDAAGRTISSTDQVGDTTSYTYSPGGQKLTTSDPRGNVTTNCYYYQNGDGQCATAAPAGGGSADNLYSTTTPATNAEPSGQTTTTTYYPGGLTKATTSPAGTATDNYDASGDLTSVTYSNTAAGYAALANLSYTYYVDGSRHTMTDASGTTTYSYDAAANTTSQAFTAGTGTGLSDTTVSYGYFTTGAPASVTYPSYTGHTSPQVTYSYDPTGAMTSETDWLGNQITFSHDSDGNTTNQANAASTSNPNGTSSTAFSFDAADRKSQTVTTLAQTCGGNETLTQALSGTNGSRNPDGQLTQYQTSYSGSCSGPTSYQRNYSYDLAGRVTYQGTSAQGSNPANLAYDPSGDPITISSHDNNGAFDTYTQTFDNAGEIASQIPVSGSGGVRSTYTYDTLGDQTQTVAGTATTTYGYNQAGQLTNATTPTTTASYLYTGDALEASATTTAGTAQLTWDTNGSLPLIVSDSTADYIYGPNNTPVEQISLSSSTPTYLTYTPSDSTWISTNAAGDETGYWGYDAYGTLAFGTPTSPFGYSGQYTDATTGLVNDRARWYQTQTGGFTTRDPAFATTDTAYTYANGDPVNEADPSGLCGTLGWFDGDCEYHATASAAGSAYNWAANNSAVTWFNQNINPVYGVLSAGRGFINCNSSFGTCFNENLNPAYGILVNGQSAIDGWNDPCVSGWDEFGRFLETGRSVVATAGVADGLYRAGAAGYGALQGGASTLSPGDLAGGTASNYGRFLKSLPSGAEEPTITQLPDGNVQFDANVPASNVPGSYATYTKVVDPEGNTVTFYKTTYAPDGSVVHVKVKYP